MLPGRNSETKPCRTIDSIDICIEYCRLMILVPMKMAINLRSPAQITSQRLAFSGALWWCMCGIARTETTETGWFLASNVNQPGTSRCIQVYLALAVPPLKRVLWNMGTPHVSIDASIAMFRRDSSKDRSKAFKTTMFGAYSHHGSCFCPVGDRVLTHPQIWE